jgi:hypothetical protein
MAFGISKNNSNGGVRNWGGNWGSFGVAANGTLTTALTGTNNDLTYTAIGAGVTGNAITIAYVVAGASTALSVSVAGNAITVNVATSSGSAATSTAAQVAAAIAAHAVASLKVNVANAPGNDGTGVVTALAATPLAGGVDWVTASGPSGYTRVKAPL